MNLYFRYLFSGKFNIVDHLLAIPPSVIKRKQLALQRIAGRITYSVPPARFREGRYVGFGGAPGERDGQGEKWSPPFEDAVDVVLNNMWKRVDRLI